MPKSAVYRQTVSAIKSIAKAMGSSLGYKIGSQAGESYGILDRIFRILGKTKSGNAMKISDQVSDAEMDVLRDAQRQYGSQDEIDAVRAYSGSTYVDINSYLYGNKSGNSHLDKLVKNLDSATGTPIGKDVILYRGANALDLKQLPANLKDAVGSTVRFRHFASFGYDFYRSFTSKPVVYALKVPSGTNAKIITDISHYKHSESEVLMARDTYVKIERIEDTGYQVIIHGTVVDQKRHK